MKNKITIVGGLGHIGLPLSVLFANKNFEVHVYDKNKDIIPQILKGKMPFLENQGNQNLKKALKKKLYFHTDPGNYLKNSIILITVGTPVDSFLNPDMDYIKLCIDELIPFLSDKQLIILRSTVFPGTSEWIDNYLKSKNIYCNISFCHERVIQGKTFEEIEKLPQIIAGNNKFAINQSIKIFKKISNKIIISSLKEAEFSKLFANTFRYIQFAVSNEFYMLADRAGLDYNKIRKITQLGYPRAEGLPKAGFAAGPCLFKDTMQLVSYSRNSFQLGASAMLVNEGLALYIHEKLEKKYGEGISELSIGILGMAFKAEIDDIRSSLSYKLKKTLFSHVKKIYCHDPYVKIDKSLVSLDLLIKNSNVVILCAPHKIYKNIKLKKSTFVIDIWDHINK